MEGLGRLGVERSVSSVGAMLGGGGGGERWKDLPERVCEGEGEEAGSESMKTHRKGEEDWGGKVTNEGNREKHT